MVGGFQVGPFQPLTAFQQDPNADASIKAAHSTFRVKMPNRILRITRTTRTVRVK